MSHGCTLSVFPGPAHPPPSDTVISAGALGADPQRDRGFPGTGGCAQVSPRYLQGDDVPSPEVDIDGVQGGWQRHPLSLAVDGRLEGCWRWRREAAKGPDWHLERGGTSRGALGGTKSRAGRRTGSRGGPGGSAETGCV